ncbi:hypothetical protein [Lactiplantibacillus plantarum]|uniref:hypothetical protein n=2 Tax=Lactiplantibacillus plantarum TaxID=1590 RepID=UPI001BBE5DE4|nr:hypothetical protein [Lactiplantibacillus plantarum]MBS0937585.1 hypothetical protein [Lactiplantibacillus plantarum]
MKAGFRKIIDGQKAASSENESTDKMQTPKLYNISSDVKGTWYSVDDQNKMYKTTFTNHTMTSSDGDKSYNETWYLDDGSDPNDTENIHNNWACVAKDPIEKNGITSVNIRGWNPGSGAGSYFGTTSEDVDGILTTVLVSTSGAGAWCDAVYYRTAAMAKKQNTARSDDLEDAD